MTANARGTYNEKVLADKLEGGVKVSRRGFEGHDVESEPYLLSAPVVRWEAKYREELPKWLKEWMEQALRQDSPVAFRETRGEFWVMLPLSWLAPANKVTTVIDPIIREVYINGERYVPG